MRQARQRVTVLGHEGINEEVDLATPNQLADCRNVWCRSGKVETRPGMVGYNVMRPKLMDSEDWIGVTEDVSTSPSTFTDEAPVFETLSLTGLEVGDRFYIGHTTTTGSGMALHNNNNANTNDTQYKLEYWNGSEWVYLPSVYQLSTNPQKREAFFLPALDSMFFNFVEPGDWATTEVNGRTAYWVRVTLLNADLSGLNVLDLNGAVSGWMTISTSAYKPVVFNRVQYPGTKRLLSLVHLGAGTTPLFQNSADIFFTDNLRDESVVTYKSVGEPATTAVIPQFSESYTAYNNEVYRHDKSTVRELATVESDPLVVGAGTRAPYDSELVLQLSQWPKAKYIQFFNGHLWCAGLEGEPYTVRWSAPTPYYKVWPELNFEYLMEDDDSPITAMYPLGEHMVVFKQDSIWLMIDSGLNQYQLRSYIPKKVPGVSGIGCVAQSSIQSVRGNLIFLSEDGLYAFDGRSASKVTLDRRSKDPGMWSDRLRDTMDSIAKGRRKQCASVHWKTEQCYLLSVTTDGSEKNGLTICWNYDKDTFWLWDGFQPAIWMVDEEANDEESVYFCDFEGKIYRFGIGITDHGGGINAYYTTRHLGIEESYRHTVLEANLTASNNASNVTVEILKNDEASGTTATFDFSDSTNEAAYDSATYDTDSYVVDRRRKRRREYRENCDFFQAKVSHSTKNEKLEIKRLELGYITQGVR